VRRPRRRADDAVRAVGCVLGGDRDSAVPGLVRAPDIAAFLDWPLTKIERILTELVAIRAIVVVTED
jgi:hypothetical protein